MQQVPFGVRTPHFLDLGPARAVETFRILLWAEASRVGIGRNLVDVPDCINVGDGGVDAFIDDAVPSRDDVIPSGSSAFQIKSGDLGPTACRRELHRGGDLMEPLKGELSRRLKRGATYVLVLMADITVEHKDERYRAISEELSEQGYGENEVRVYTANQLAAFAQRLPAVFSWLNAGDSWGQSYATWSQSRDVSQPKSFVADSVRETQMQNIRDRLRNRTNCPTIRITGLPGIGKSRLVFEALSPDDLRNQVVYFRGSAQFFGSALLRTIESDPEMSAVVVIDECDLGQHRQVIDSLGNLGERLAIITISYEVGKVPLPTIVTHVEPLNTESIEQILKTEYAGLPPLAAYRLARFADGYPRIADMLARQYVNEGQPSGYFGPNDDYLMRRLVGGSASADSERFRITKRVMMYLSLFERIGVAGRGEAEGKWLAEEAGVGWPDFREVVANEKSRGIIQGENYIFVTPLMLRIYLLEEWWGAHGFDSPDGLKDFVGRMPEADLPRRFYDHFKYVAADERGARFVEKLLGTGEFFSGLDALNSEIGGQFFFALAEADPASALSAAQQALGGLSRDELLQFRAGRRSMVEALARMAIWKEQFRPAATLLLKLAEAENETWDNNASGEFARLFATGFGIAASTEAPFKDRLPILQEAMSSDSDVVIRLALEGCRHALRTGSYGAPFAHGIERLGREPTLWYPTNGELFDAFRSAWELVANAADRLEDELQSAAVEILLGSTRQMAGIPSLTDSVLNTLRQLANRGGGTRVQVISSVAELLHFDGRRMKEDILSKWQALAEELSGSDFVSRMERYVALELFIDQVDEDGNSVDKVGEHIEGLAIEAVREPVLLSGEFSWLVTSHTDASSRFGYALGRNDAGRKFLHDAFNAQIAAGMDGTLSFLGGYMRAISELDEEIWEGILDLLSGQSPHETWVAELTARSAKLTPRSSKRVLGLLQRDLITPDQLRMFRFGRSIRDLEDDDFGEWVDILLERDELSAVATALDLLVMRGGYGMSREPAMRIVSHPAWFRASQLGFSRTHDEFWWAHVAKSLCDNHPDVIPDIVGLILNNAGNHDTVSETLDGDVGHILEVALNKDPQSVWEMASSLLGPPIDARAHIIGWWLRGREMFEPVGSRLLEEIPSESIWEWVDGDPEWRSRRLAGIVPQVLNGPEGAPCLARDLLVKYGQDKEVRDSLLSNFYTGGFMGPESLYWSEKLAWLRGLRTGETNSNVLTWLSEFESVIAELADYAHQEEERLGY